MEKFYMVYISGAGKPKVVHENIESAREAIQSYRSLGGMREAYIMTPCEVFEGRKVLKLKKK